ncbi:MAG: aminotransferase class I/II-fold pyridoxal phosphate-dependent enzyme [Nitrososphaerota archaeon]|jgi:aspartate aminotransferase|nr:aminotransferase class I/II-fold pyridoxal phosphate-dependent enzyme [Nitrososphaerota archaeon]MDG6903208.1 aminotransferase class I/II-fold pyridoxal phosphate-dependent enzyme [Nitrososphaerota archaeon]MDG6911686.1 aminotransferase class I/II-fold pyridoxal phosphate-dependent enzyme [Nitrososphaerota archaeon]MDG6940588.1 aminotransferase class I/II-fold pyridoxal phosphate-dependent enzyme [Nitrososphaerota archaeon]MDG6960899.1 aminotransferase class I/II-fold pyridoxal phosphate-dep
MTGTKPEVGIDELRVKIAETTVEIIRLAGRRNNLAREVGRLKAIESIPIEDDAVEDSLLREVTEECDRAGVDRSAGLKMLALLLAESKKAQGIQALQSGPSPMSVFAKAVELQRGGVKLIRLDVGEPDFRPPRAVLNACSGAMFGFKTHYTEARGIPELLSALRGYLRRKSGFAATEDEIAVTPSGRFAVYASLSAVVSEGDSAIVPEPNWPAYREVLKHLGAKPIVIHGRLEDGWSLSAGEVERAIRPNTKAIILSYPNNPTGKVISQEAFREVVQVADDRGLTVVSDEIYNEYSSKPCPSVLHTHTAPKKFVMTSSFSKAWAMTGFRIGYVVSSKDIIARVASMTSLVLSSVPEFIQHGAIKALDSDTEVKKNVAVMNDRVEAISRELDRIGSLEYVKPDGAMYFFPRLRKPGLTGGMLAESLLQRGVTVTPGVAFGSYEDFFRISLGQPKEVILEGVRRMGDLLA